MVQHIKGCKINRTEAGWAVKKTVFSDIEEAKAFAFYLRICILNKKKVVYVKDFEEAYSLHIKSVSGHESIGWKNWLQLCWNRNGGRYLNVSSGIYAVDNLNDLTLSNS